LVAVAPAAAAPLCLAVAVTTGRVEIGLRSLPWLYDNISTTIYQYGMFNKYGRRYLLKMYIVV